MTSSRGGVKLASRSDGKDECLSIGGSMRILWTLLKVIIGLAVAIPLFIIVSVTALGVLGTLLGLAIVALKLAFVGLAGYTLFRLLRALMAPAPKPAPISV